MNWESVVIKGNEVRVAFDENSVHVYNAYPIKDDLKLRGYRWNPADKSWHSNPADVLAELEVLKNNLQQAAPVPVPERVGELEKFPASCSVSELRNRIDRLLKDGLKGRIWIRGVVASEVNNYRWMSYFDLKDEDENLNIYFKVEIRPADLESINSRLRDSGAADCLDRDLPVFVLVEVHLSLRNAVDIRLRLVDILPEYTQAKIRNLRDITVDKLKTEGVLENQERLTLPALVHRLGLITSGQGTSSRDILAGLHPYEDKYEFHFVDTRMEGPHAVESVIRAVDLLEHSAAVSLDAIIIARGGGSEQSLAVFNDYRLCRRVCDCNIPVLTAIGHEKDLSAVEICSFYTPTPSTPSGLGKFMKERFVNLQLQLSDTVQKLTGRLANLHSREIEKLKALARNVPRYIRNFLKLEENRLLAKAGSLEQSVSFTVRGQERWIEGMMNQVLLKDKGYYMSGRNNLRHLLLLILNRARAQRDREQTQVEKTVGRIDFGKRRRVAGSLSLEIGRKSMTLIEQSRRRALEEERAVNNLVDLVSASDPQRILKRGFTMTLDENGRVVESLQEFRSAAGPRLKFHDGVIRIRKEEDA